MSRITFNAPVAEMNCTGETSSSTPDPKATTDIWDGILPAAQDAEPGFTKAMAAIGAAITADLLTDYFIIDKLFGHRPDPECRTLFEINVRWEGDEDTWEPEINLQTDAAPALFAYWRGVEGGRESAMEDKGLWHVSEVVSHDTKPDGRIFLEVAWVGSPDTTWEPEAKIRKAARDLVDSYWRFVGSRPGGSVLSRTQPW
ncbi:hypothetical protein CSUB01_08022 [Colletotrichum sublineola]|uniref:Chromo domain-containing protein n=1 Tax=Colletotrichum sublineola TaxID=1173701 RepID=A0A066X2M9_COLSU|nr:hypothetical protein CSUB01_08022 [Colletotrichum sublineola]